jgi:hypothetical protein
MNEKFVAWAIKVHTDHPELVQQWAKSTDITERALASGIQQAIDKSMKKGNTTCPTESRTAGRDGAYFEEKASHFLFIANSSSVYINKSMQLPEVMT